MGRIYKATNPACDGWWSRAADGTSCANCLLLPVWGVLNHEKMRNENLAWQGTNNPSHAFCGRQWFTSQEPTAFVFALPGPLQYPRSGPVCVWAQLETTKEVDIGVLQLAWVQQFVSSSLPKFNTLMWRTTRATAQLHTQCAKLS